MVVSINKATQIPPVETEFLLDRLIEASPILTPLVAFISILITGIITYFISVSSHKKQKVETQNLRVQENFSMLASDLYHFYRIYLESLAEISKLTSKEDRFALGIKFESSRISLHILISKCQMTTPYKNFEPIIDETLQWVRSIEFNEKILSMNEDERTIFWNNTSKIGVKLEQIADDIVKIVRKETT